MPPAPPPSTPSTPANGQDPSGRVAVVGSGVAGLTAAWIASRTRSVTLYEADDRLGGHADTHLVDGLAVDTGFIVHNRRTYPTLLRLFDELGVRTQPSEMSLSVRDDALGLEYAGARKLPGLFPGGANLGRPSYWRMLTEIPRFHRAARRLLDVPESAGDPVDERGADGKGSADETLGDFLARHGFSSYFERCFIEPLVAAVWSCDPQLARRYPARYLFTFLAHHGMLGVSGSPTWRTVAGGSRSYVDAIVAAIPDVRTATAVSALRETPDGVLVTDRHGTVEQYDAVVVATHPDQALALLEEPTPTQRKVLEALPYTHSSALLHTDETMLPRRRQARASWNFLRRPEGDADAPPVTVTYDLTRLMRLPTQRRYLVTLGGDDLVDPATVLARRDYAHPQYTPESVAAQGRLEEVHGQRVAFAGAYHGWGFHEDGARSGAAAARRLGWEWPEPATPPLPATSPAPVRTPVSYRTTINHRRSRPFGYGFRHRSRLWLVDVDEAPRFGPLGRVDPGDHFGDPAASLRENAERFLVANGVEPDGGRILLATQPRALGYCFNPISIWWCHRRDGTTAAVLLEVHNTYGDRHVYLVDPDGTGRAEVDKAMYVSPFHGVTGEYRVLVQGPGKTIRVSIELHGDDSEDGHHDEPFRASLVAQHPDPRRRALLATAPAALRGSLLIRFHGIRLWLRRLPIRARPVHPTQEGVS